MLLAQDLLLRNPGAKIVYDVKCTSLKSDLRKWWRALMVKTGHSILNRDYENHAALGGDSADISFKNDGMGLMMRFILGRALEILSKQRRRGYSIF